MRDSVIASVAARRRRVARALPALTAATATAARFARRTFRRGLLVDLADRVPTPVRPLVLRTRNIVASLVSLSCNALPALRFCSIEKRRHESPRLGHGRAVSGNASRRSGGEG